MNKSRRHRPRLVCSVVRLWESSRGPAATGCSSPTARHMQGCPECRAFFTEDIGFEQSLRRDATRLSAVSPDAGLEQRILREVKAAEARPGAERESRRELSPVWGRALLASAAAALAVVLWPRWSVPAPVSKTPPVVATKATVVTPEPRLMPEPVVAAPAIAAWWSVLETRGAALAKAEKNPLEREMDSVRTDARAVVGFLALNFMPSKPIRETPPSRG